MSTSSNILVWQPVCGVHKTRNIMYSLLLQAAWQTSATCADVIEGTLENFLEDLSAIAAASMRQIGAIDC